MGEKGEGLRSTTWLWNGHGDVECSIGNIVTGILVARYGFWWVWDLSGWSLHGLCGVWSLGYTPETSIILHANCNWKIKIIKNVNKILNIQKKKKRTTRVPSEKQKLCNLGHRNCHRQLLSFVGLFWLDPETLNEEDEEAYSGTDVLSTGRKTMKSQHSWILGKNQWQSTGKETTNSFYKSKSLKLYKGTILTADRGCYKEQFCSE